MNAGYHGDDRIVMTMDGGGTHFVFSAVCAGQQMASSLLKPARGDDLVASLKTVIDGFAEIRAGLPRPPVAISFSFPGPSDFRRGIIGDLVNLPAYRGGVALGPMLEERFRLPVFCNNDGDLFALGEAMAGLLPQVNGLLEASKNPRRFRNLLGVTLGTGFGGGIVRSGEIFLGDNAASGEINRIRNRLLENGSAEEIVSISGIRRLYARYAKIPPAMSPDPKEIYHIGTGDMQGNREASVRAFRDFGIAAGDALANAATLVDGLVVIGGGLSGAHPLFLSALVKEMNRPFCPESGPPVSRLEVEVFDLEDAESLTRFVLGKGREITVPFSNRKITHDPFQRIGVGISRLGTDRAVSLGAYTFALRELDRSRIDPSS